MIQAITLDLDDTLWPVLPTLIGAEKALAQWLLKHAPATASYLNEAARTKIRDSLVARFPGQAHNMSWLRLELLREGLQQAGDDPSLAEPAFDTFLHARQLVTFYDDVHHVLASWAQRYPLVAISNGNADIHRVGLSEYFTAAVSAHEQGFAKPDPRMFEAAREHTGVALENTLHIGDDWQMDIHAARRIGMQTAWIKRPDLNHKPVPDEGADMPVYDDLHAIDRFLHDPSP